MSLAILALALPAASILGAKPAATADASGASSVLRKNARLSKSKALKKQDSAASVTAPTPSPLPVVAVTPVPAPSEQKPAFEALLKPKSLNKVLEDYDIISSSSWNDDEFAFVNAALIRTPLHFSRPLIMDFSLYPKMSSAIQKFEYDPATQLIEVIGEKHGLRMHSWIKVDQAYWDVIRYTFVRGDLTGFKIDAYLWDHKGKTLAIAKGQLPRAKQMLPTFVALLFKPVSEVVLSVATKNFRSYIEEEYQKRKDSSP